MIVLLLLATPAFAFEPMPPIMQALLQVYPEEGGQFIDEPFGSTDQMPDEARPLFETFRVVVPTVDDIEKNLARLFGASSYLKIRKITRYDRDPGAPGLPGFRGVWCQTENKDDVGFSIVTINQNRFLIWAKMGYYPAYGNDSINPKVRDQYARDVSQYLAGVDLKVPENVAPEAGGRGLPAWMGIQPSVTQEGEWWSICRDSLALRSNEINSWGFRGVWAIAPTAETIDSIIAHVRDTLWSNAMAATLQSQFQRVVEGFYSRHNVSTLTKARFDSLSYGTEHDFVVDRFGRIRICQRPPEGESNQPPELYFAAAPILTHGAFRTRRVPEWSHGIPPELETVRVECSPYFINSAQSIEGRNRFQPALDEHMQSVGHFLRAVRDLGISLRFLVVSRLSNVTP